MGREIERKFLVQGDQWRNDSATEYRQGYLSTDKKHTVRVRAVGEQACLTIKGVSKGATRAEYEYEIPLSDADEMLDELCEKPVITKKRFIVEYKGLTWEVDEFRGENQGLILAEVELDDADQEVELPPWIGKEVTDDPRYFNSNLVKNPYREWTSDDVR